MNYHKIYNQIIENRRLIPYKGYVERHHIIPKCIGGTDDRSNLVELSAREHFICHLLLTKMYPENTHYHYKIVKAFMMMLVCRSQNQERFLTSKRYESLRIKFSQAQSISQRGEKNSQYGKPRSEDVKNKIQQTLLEKNRESKEKRIHNEKIKKIDRQKKKEERLTLYREYYRIYNNVGWKQFVQETGYQHSHPNFVMMCKKILPEFVSQNRIKRGNNAR